MDGVRRTGRLELALLVATTAGLVAGLALRVTLGEAPANAAWTATTALGLVPAIWWLVDSLRQRELGVDLVAVLALAGSLAVGEYLAGAIIAVMLATGRALEARAEARAGRELHALLARAPRTATRHAGTELETVPVEALRVGDLVLVRPGEVVPVDGRLTDPRAVLDESALTGEPLPVPRGEGDEIPSGIVNAGGAFTILATTDATTSTYAGIVRLVQEARASSAPFVRLANRYAAWFVPVTLLLAAAAWIATNDPVRAVAVLVVATPCPLLLAAPIAIVAGLSRAARRGIVVKGGSALERLADGRTLLLDKTGTLTRGTPELRAIEAEESDDPGEVLRLAASLDQASPHILASAVVRAARARGLALSTPTSVEEAHGLGARGIVDGHDVRVGRAAWVSGRLPAWASRVRRRAARDEGTAVFIGIDGQVRGIAIFTDPIRADASRTVRRLRDAGISRIVLVTGDRAEVAESVASALGIDRVLAERTPAEKVEAVRVESAATRTIMVGDGLNDAPALAAAGVGVAMGARGSTASSEAADIVLAIDRLDRLGEAIHIARRARGIALQSVVIGMGLSFAGMLAAAVGWLPPTAGAILQEAIDVVVILNALRALGAGRGAPPQLTGRDADLTIEYLHAHGELRQGLDRIRSVADALHNGTYLRDLTDARRVHDFMAREVVPHEEEEERELYPAVARALGGVDPTGPMVRTHAEIRHLTTRLGRLLDDIADTGDAPDDVDVVEVQRVLYGLHAVLELHFAQEEESYFSLAEPG